MKNKIKFDLLLMCFLAVTLLFSACEDERELPVTPPTESYTETITLLDTLTANGQDMWATFDVLEEVEDGFITVACFLKPDAALTEFETVQAEIDALEDEIEAIGIEIINIQLLDTLTAADSSRLDSLRATETAKQAEVLVMEVKLDSLDTWLDDRFKLSLWMDADTVEFYPRAVFLNSSSHGANGEPMDYLGDQSVVWGQGFYLSLYAVPPWETDTTSYWRGMSVRLDIEEFWVGDGGWDIGGKYIHSAKPARDASYTNQYPIRNVVTRLTPGPSHTLHFRFGSAVVTAKVTASLYVVYKTAVRR